MHVWSGHMDLSVKCLKKTEKQEVAQITKHNIFGFI